MAKVKVLLPFFILLICPFALGAFARQKREESHKIESHVQLDHAEAVHAESAYAEAAHAEPAHGEEAEAEHEGGHGHGHHGYQVFHEEFSRVQIPFIIALWIVIASLLKIGKNFKIAHPCLIKIEPT